MDKCRQGELRELHRCINALKYLNSRKMGFGNLSNLIKKTRIKTNVQVENHKVYHNDELLLITVNWQDK